VRNPPRSDTDLEGIKALTADHSDINGLEKHRKILIFKPGSDEVSRKTLPGFMASRLFLSVPIRDIRGSNQSLNSTFQ
jgi:hypothetical protein